VGGKIRIKALLKGNRIHYLGFASIPNQPLLGLSAERKIRCPNKGCHTAKVKKCTTRHNAPQSWEEIESTLHMLETMNQEASGMIILTRR
jgi:hypothetical protein